MIESSKNNEINDKKGAFCALTSSMAYGLNNPLAALGVSNGIPSIYSAAFRAMIMLLVSGLIITAKNKSFHVPKKARLSVIIMTITTTLISLCYVGSINFISVSLAAIIFFTFPIQILIYSIVFKKEKLEFIDISIFISIFFGLVFVITPDLSGINYLGLFLALISSVSATFLYFAGSVAAKNCNPIIIGFWIHLFSFPAISIVSYIIFKTIDIPSVKLLFPILIMALCYVMAYYFQMLSLKYTSPLKSSLFFNAEPVMTGIAAAIILNEKLMPVQYLGAFLVFSALVINGLRKKI